MNYSVIPKLPRSNNWCLRMDKKLHFTFYWAYNYLSLLEKGRLYNSRSLYRMVNAILLWRQSQMPLPRIFGCGKNCLQAKWYRMIFISLYMGCIMQVDTILCKMMFRSPFGFDMCFKTFLHINLVCKVLNLMSLTIGKYIPTAVVYMFFICFLFLSCFVFVVWVSHTSVYQSWNIILDFYV